MVDATLKQKIFNNIKEHVKSWNVLTSTDDIKIIRLNGMSNACFKVEVVKSKRDPSID